ncbi:14503_t:CDS:2, partial [Funneliformis geosporum]
MTERIFRRGSETQKSRPGVIISNNKQNQFSGAVIVALITSQTDKVYFFEVEIEVEGKSNKVITDQIYTVDKNRLERKMGVLNEKQLRKLAAGLHTGYKREKALSLRIELDNHDDQIDLRRIIPFGNLPLMPSQTKERKRNIIKAEKFFSSKINAKNYLDIYQTILDNFYLSLITLDEETDSEIFMTLNTAGEDLTIPDLVKSLLTRRNDFQARKFAEIWEEKIVKKICFPPTSKKNRNDKILRYYRTEIKPKNPEENSKFLDLMMFRTISDIHLLNRKELFSLVLAIHFQFQEKTREEKLMITKELKKLVIYIFRTIIIKGKIEDENALRTIRINILKMVNLGQILLFGQEKYPINLIIEEFRQGADSFYQSLVERQSKKDKGLEIEKFIFITYYQKKIKESELIINLFDYDIRQL